jgi:hypothetical protein
MTSAEQDPGARLDELRERYRDFARDQARGVSPLYEALALAVAESEPLLRFVAALPAPKQQPNLVFAAVRYLFGTPRDARHFARLVQQHPEPIRALALTRRTQTNEPARCATLLPVLARLPQPLALLEVGTSAGLCLLPDHYAYDYGTRRIEPAASVGPPPPVFACRASPDTPLPRRAPRVVWRAGLDLNPLDVRDADAMRWLETLVWPGAEEAGRVERLRAAVEIARRARPRIVRGDLLADLPALAAEAPRDATLVVFHTAVLIYVDVARRARFARLVAELGAAWVSNEFAGLLPGIAAKLRRRAPADRLLLSLDGEPVAFTGPHGQSLDWLG